METTLFFIIIGIIIFDFLFDRTIDYLNASRWSNTLPEALRGIYDEEKYRKSQDYFMANLRFGSLKATFSLFIVLSFLLLGGFQFLDEWVRQFTEHPILLALMFFGIIGIVSDLISTPFDVYDTFVIEEKFGFNRTTVKTYITDKIKGWLLAVIIGGGLLAIFVWFFQLAGNLFWL